MSKVSLWGKRFSRGWAGPFSPPPEKSSFFSSLLDFSVEECTGPPSCNRQLIIAFGSCSWKTKFLSWNRPIQSCYSNAISICDCFSKTLIRPFFRNLILFGFSLPLLISANGLKPATLFSPPMEKGALQYFPKNSFLSPESDQ